LGGLTPFGGLAPVWRGLAPVLGAWPRLCGVRLPASAYSLRPLADSSMPARVSVHSGRTIRIELAETPPVTQKGVTLKVVE
jgi:hypothetical protein